MTNPSTVHIGRSLTVKGITPTDTHGIEITDSKCPNCPAITSALPTWYRRTASSMTTSNRRPWSLAMRERSSRASAARVLSSGTPRKATMADSSAAA
jgi:hypothetical protein